MPIRLEGGAPGPNQPVEEIDVWIGIHACGRDSFP